MSFASNTVGTDADDTLGLGDLGLGEANRYQGGNGDDTYYVDDREDKVVEFAGGGVDTVISTVTWALNANIENLTLAGTARIGGVGNDRDNVILGNDNWNSFDGKAGNDTINGMGGNDYIKGGVGNDILTGGEGADKFVFTTAIGDDVDTITDFVSGVDLIVLDLNVFSGLSAANLNASKIIYDEATGSLSYDADGARKGAAVEFAVLDGHPAFDLSDILLI